MSKVKAKDPDMAERYDFSSAKRGVYYQRAKAGIKVVHVADEADKARSADDPHARKPPKGSKSAG